jgi:hypothetical protein
VIEAVSQAKREQPRTAAADGPSTAPWLIGFVLLHLTCQLLLLVPALTAERIFVRTAAFSTGLAFLVVIPAKHTLKVPVRGLALCILGLLGLEFFHPETGGLLAGFAALMLNLAVLAPIFWVPRTAVTPLTFQRLVVTLWLYYTASAVLGVLQAYFPGRFEPALSSAISAHGREASEALQIKLVSGEWTFRPMGLTDTPGGAASAGLYAIVLGTGVVLLEKPPFSGARIVAMGSLVAGTMCIYLCQIRSLLVMALICLVTLGALLLVTGRVSRMLGLFATIGAVIPGAFMLAVALGGQSMINRLNSLVSSDPGTVYYNHRGRFLDVTINEYLPLYPLGAGLGRWGMIHTYFGGETSLLWVEIQWTGWLFDGGFPLVLLYLAAMIVVSLACLRVALGRVGAADSSLSVWGAVLVAYNVGTFAICFNYPIFSGTGGVEFWLLNIALLCAAQNSDRGLLRSVRV